MANSDVAQFHSVHQMVECHVGIATSETREQRRHEAAESNNRVPAEGAEQKIEPDYVGLQTVKFTKDAVHTPGIIE